MKTNFENWIDIDIFVKRIYDEDAQEYRESYAPQVTFLTRKLQIAPLDTDYHLKTFFTEYICFSHKVYMYVYIK